ncbi:hypothetical protein V3C99_014858 [Haemonchus contortus]
METQTTSDLTVMRVQDTSKTEIFLLTGTLRTVHPRTQKLVTLHVLLDTGADRSFIDAKLANELQLESHGVVTMKLKTFGAATTKEVQCIDTRLKIWDSEGEQHKLRLFTHSNLTRNFTGGKLQKEDLLFIQEKHIRLSIPDKGILHPPQILIGCDQLWNFIKFGAPHFMMPSGLILVPTRLGYMVSGERLNNRNNEQHLHSTVHSIESQGEIDPWESHWSAQPQAVEQEYGGPEKEEKARINEQVWEKFKNTIEKRDIGYVVRLPFKEPHDHLPDNRALVLRRLKSVLRKYEEEPSVLKQYHDVFQDQLSKGILEEVDETNDVFGKPKHYLPHQPVITPQKDTTKFRVVFDASAHYKNCPSLNDVVHQGPTILPKLYGMLLRFRTGKFVLLSDVEKAFLQVHLHEEDRDFTRCLWLKNVMKPVTEDNLVVYRFRRVTFGINASPFLLSATIHFHLDNHVKDKALATEIASNLYVDNLIVSAITTKEGIHKYRCLKSIFNDLKMNLRAFLSNNPEIMKVISAPDRSSNTAPKVLGIPWNSITDKFSLCVNVQREEIISKRTIAQQIASVYDPFGWFIPLFVKAKHFQQFLWKHHYDWDEPLNERHRQQWENIVQEIAEFRKELPRKITQDDMKSYTLVTYSDASAIAMTACTYLSTEDTSHFLMAKSKISNAKHPTTIPKMELNAIAIGVRLTFNVFLSMKSSLNISKIVFLTDSEIALKWLQSKPNRERTGVYVKNRIREVRQITQSLLEEGIEVKYGYIDTKWNPADIGTRGTSTQEFSSHIWWSGYSQNTLKERFTSTLFCLPDDPEQEDEVEDYLPSAQVNATKMEQSQVEDILDLSRYSSKSKSLRILAYVIRFLKRISTRIEEPLRTKLQRVLPGSHERHTKRRLTASDIKDAHIVLIRNHQTVHLHSHYKKELLKNLNAKQDQEHLYRAYGRLNKSDLDSMARNPILIVPNTELARLIVLEAHGKYHNNTGHTMGEVRQQYWIPRLREQVKRCIRSCVPCQKFNNLPYRYPEMTDLPEKRVTRSWPFKNIGLDYFGPITVIDSAGSSTEVYGCIFTCCVTRLIHLEVVTDGTTEKFLNAFRRFVARRGKPRSVTCDNAPTFILGSHILNESLETDIEEDELSRNMSNQVIEWKHITPYSPWKGGFYERLIKSVKEALIKATGKRTMTLEQLITSLVEIEGCLNSRPLTYQESDIKDSMTPLRPIDFIQNEMNVTLPLNDPKEEHTDPTYLPAVERIRLETRLQAQKALRSSCAITERFWELWRNQYLTALREQHRRNINDKRGSRKDVQEGEVVLLSEPNQKRSNWKLARISKTVPSSDGAIREVEVYCNKRTLRRPVNQLVPLELGENPTLPSQTSENQPPSPQENGKGYNLRPRRRVQHTEDHPQSKNTVNCLTSQHTSRTWPASLYLKMALTLVTLSIVSGQKPSMQRSIDTSSARADYTIECRKHGVFLHAPESHGYELCANSYCIVEKTPPINRLLRLPPEELIHDFDIRWKLKTANSYTVVETHCPAQSFCAAIDCTICSANILNPECWPLAAIIGLGITLYLLVAICYTICYVPVTLGRPLRIILQGTQKIIHIAIGVIVTYMGLLVTIFYKGPRQRPSRIMEALAVLTLACGSLACQEVNILPHQIQHCRTAAGRSICNIESTTIVKVNPFKRDGCLTFKKNNSTFTKARLRWEGLRLLCNREPLLYTRNVIQKIVDSKRCSSKGSCTKNKCADINATSLLPELEIGNKYPGITYCMESCGGPGCGCFHWDSGCLLYRIYAVPKDDTVYELYKCIRWEEEVKLRFEFSEGTKLQTYVVGLRPNIPTRIRNFELTLSVLSIPPTSALEHVFIRSKNHTAIWDKEKYPILDCPSLGHAQLLQCNMRADCACSPAENQVVCRCEEDDVGKAFLNIEQVLPLIHQQVHFSQHPHHAVIAKVEQDVTAEITLNLKEAVTDVRTENEDDICLIENTDLTGCYQCNKGARALVIWRSKILRATS